jgi:hypothetical protein
MIRAVKSISKHGPYNHSVIGVIVNNKYKAVAPSYAATWDAAQFKSAVTKALVSMSMVHVDCMSPVQATPQYR